MKKSDSINREKLTGWVVDRLAAHPYLWALALCLFVNPFFLGSIQNIPSGALWLETLMVMGAAAAFGYYQYRSGAFDRPKLALFYALAILADGFAIKLYAQSQNKAAWHLAGGCAIVLILRFAADAKRHQRQLDALTVIGLGSCLKLYYILVTSVYTRQHDVGSFGGGDSHAGYIEYLLFHHRLPDFDVREVWQFYHPPLHHAISAVWIHINENILLTGHNPARESLQTLTLFYSICIVISAYRILRHFRLEGRALFIPLLVISFHPAFILFSGSINNDALSVALMMGAVVSTLKWSERQTMKGILKIALCIGFGMMTKISAAVVAPPVALVFLAVLIKKLRTDGKKLMGQFTCFGLVCIPLGLWFGIRNFIKWGVPLTYVSKLGTNSDQYIGDRSFLSRVTDLSPYQFGSVYEQWVRRAGEYNEFNPLVALMKTSLFGEWNIVDESAADLAGYIAAAPAALFWINVAIAGFALAAMLAVCLRNARVRRRETLFLAGFHILMVAGFYKMAADYPHVCTMDFRYITPTVIVGAVFIGLFLEGIGGRNKRLDNIVSVISGGGAFLFALCSGIVYSTLHLAG